MISFLICIDGDGIVNDINWSIPAYLVPMRSSSFVELFPAEEKKIVLDLIKRSMEEEDLLQSDQPLHLNNLTPRVRLSLLKADDQILVFAAEDVESIDEHCKREFSGIACKFMQTIRAYFKSNAVHNKESIGYQFDRIQILNNDLVNTRRMLEKTNSQLNRLNQDLNNRLVKDALTGLVSRYQYRAEIDLMISADPGKLGIFTFIDIDEFKKINDCYGHAAGDLYLVEFAERLKSLPMDNTLKMRIAGDEFGIFTYGLNQVEDAEVRAIWNQIKDYVLTKPFVINGSILSFSVCAGMAVYGVDTTEIYEIIEFADFAMYQAKESGKNRYQRFDQDQYKLRGQD